uniref:Uncharacterized protein n=1 Tax=Vespula pensylvanica TaxID=30213 RepID=A0A834P763_VESPE|nr:hypothetical protein H0235_004262 [Vespula pensylvanica]
MGHRVDKGRVNNTASELATQTPLIKVELELGPPLGVLANRKISLTNSVGILYGGDGGSSGSSGDGGDGGGGSGRCGSFHKRAVTRGTLEAGFQDPGTRITALKSLGVPPSAYDLLEADVIFHR